MVLIELGDLNGFSNAIVKVTSDNELRKKKMGEISKINSNKFSKPEIMKSWDLVFKDIIKKGKMKLIIDNSNLFAGGGLQVAASFLRDLKKKMNLSDEFHIIQSLKCNKGYRK